MMPSPSNIPSSMDLRRPRRFWQHPSFILVLILGTLIGTPFLLLSQLRLGGLGGQTLLQYHAQTLAQEKALMADLVQADPVWGPKVVEQRTFRHAEHAETLRTLVTFPGNRFAVVGADDHMVDVALPLAQWQDAVRLQHAAGHAPADGGSSAAAVRVDLDQRAPGLFAQITGLSMAPWCLDCTTVQTREGDLLGLDRANGLVWMHLRLDQIDDFLSVAPARSTPPDQDYVRVG